MTVPGPPQVRTDMIAISATAAITMSGLNRLRLRNAYSSGPKPRSSVER